MSADRDIRRLNKLLDVNSAGITNGDVPTWDTNVSSFTMGPGGGGFDMTVGGNSTSGGAGFALISTGTMTLAGGTNITLSQDGNAVSILGGAGGGGTQTFVGGIAASNTTYTSGTVQFTGVGGGITVSSNAGQRVDLSVAAPVAQTVQTQNVIDLTLNGNTAGVLALMSSGTVSLAGGNNVTLSQAGNAITISAASQSVQPETQTFLGGIQNSQTTYTSGTVSLSVEGGALTIRSTTGQAFRFSVSQSVQPAQTGISGIQNSQTTYTSGTVSLSDLANITIRSTTGNAYQFSVAAQSVQPETQTFLAGIQNSQTTYTSGTVNLSVEGGALTIRSTTGQAFRFSISQSVQPETQTAISGIQNSQTTYTSGTVSLSELGAITIRSTTGNAFQFSVAAQSLQPVTNFSGGVSTFGNTAGSTGVTGTRLVLVGTNAVSLSQSTDTAGGTVTWNVATTPSFSAGASSFGNTAGATGVSGTRLVLVGTNNITLSQTTDASGATISISAPASGAFSGGISNLGNTAGSTGVTGTRLVLVGTSGISLSQSTDANGGTITINTPPEGTISMWPDQAQSTALSAVNTASLYFVTNATTARTTVTAIVFPLAMPQNLSVNKIIIPAHVSMSSGTTNANWSFTNGQSLGIYSLNGVSLSLLSSFSNNAVETYQSAAASTNASATFSMSYGSGNALSLSTSFSTNNAGVTGFWNSVSGNKRYPYATGAMSMSAGQYFGVYAFTTSTGGANDASLMSVGMNTGFALPLGREVAGNVASVTAAWPLMGQVSMTQTDTALQASFLTSDVSTTATAGAANLDRYPAVQFYSQL